MEIAIIASLVYIIDRLAKMWIVSHFMLGESLPIIPNVFHITYILNRGAAFGILANRQAFFLGIVLILLVSLVVFRKRIKNSPQIMKIGIGLLVGGALGNAYDRLTTRAVVDFFDFRIWPIFNIADIAICIGVGLIMYFLWQDESV